MGRALGMKKAFIVFNPKAGKENRGDELRATLASHFVPQGFELELYETTGKEDVAEICRAACARGVSLVVAAGGDGTLVGVANGLKGSSVPLGILPLGSANFMARALLIPLKLEEAVALLVGDHALAEVDALESGGRWFFTNVGVGISPGIIKGTRPADKKLFGRLAYVITMVRGSNIFQSHRYRLWLDGRLRSVLAAEVMVSNSTMLARPDSLFGLPESLSDGRLEVYALSTRTVGDYLRLARDLFLRSGTAAAKLSHWTAFRSVRIDSPRSSVLVQADGEVIGRTPVEIRMIPRAIRVVTPLGGMRK